MKVLLIFALIFPSAAVFSYFHFASSPEATRFWYTASKALQFSLPILGILAFGAQRKWTFKLQEWKLGLVSGLVILSLLLILYFSLRGMPFLADTSLAIQKKLVDFGADTPLRYALLAIFISVAHSFLEEYYWRGFVYSELKAWIGGRPALLISALGFTGHHIVVIHKYCPPEYVWALVPLFSAFVFVAGIIWSKLYDRSSSLAGAWISHLFADVAILLIGAHLVFGGIS